MIIYFGYSDKIIELNNVNILFPRKIQLVIYATL